jgi:hypothetical protein
VSDKLRRNTIGAQGDERALGQSPAGVRAEVGARRSSLAIARGPPPRARRPAASHPQRRPRPVPAGRWIDAAGLVAVRHLRPRVARLDPPPCLNRCWVPPVHQRRLARPARAVARGPSPRPGRRASPDPQRRARPPPAGHRFSATAVVALRHLRARVAHSSQGPIQRRLRLPTVRPRAPRPRATARPARAVARGPAPRPRRRAAPDPQRRPRPPPAGHRFSATAVVALRHLRPRMAHAAEHTSARAWLPGMPPARFDRAANAGRARAVARGPAPRPGRRAAPDPQRRPGRLRGCAVVRAAGLVAVRKLRARVAGNPSGP